MKKGDDLNRKYYYIDIKRIKKRNGALPTNKLVRSCNKIF